MRALFLTATVATVAFSVITAPSASAVPTLCSNQTFTSSGTCTLDAGATITFTIKAGDGGSGGMSSTPYLAPGGMGGAGARVTGTYTNMTATVQTLTVTVGAVGTAGTSGTFPGGNGTSGGNSSLAVSATTIVTVTGGTGGAGGIISSGNPGTAGQLTFPTTAPASWTVFTQTWANAAGSVVFGAETAGPIAANDASSKPTPVIQQFGKTTATACQDIARTDLNWAGVGSGGWSDSWAQWMNDGKGGSVCTRTLVYAASGGWVVQ